MNAEPRALPGNCRICGGGDWSVLYAGPIRTGRFGEWSAEQQTVWQCGSCDAGYLDHPPVDYESDQYRTAVDGSGTPEHYYRLHDGEQAERLSVAGSDALRGKVIADVGCGAGSFLDLLSGYAAATIAVEPAQAYHEALRAKGHEVFSYCDSAVARYRGKVDLIVSFAVIEHVDDPLQLMQDMRQLLAPGGSVLVSTPNRNDWMLDLLPEAYGRFFYRQVHTWYFNRHSLQTLGRLAGFSSSAFHYTQRFDISNALLWARDGRPTGTGAFAVLQGLDGAYRHYVEQQGRSDFMYARLSAEEGGQCPSFTET